MVVSRSDVVVGSRGALLAGGGGGNLDKGPGGGGDLGSWRRHLLCPGPVDPGASGIQSEHLRWHQENRPSIE